MFTCPDTLQETASPPRYRARPSAPVPVARPEAAGAQVARGPESERHSLAAILDLIRSGQATTRLELERTSFLGRAVVSDRVATLARLGLVEEGAPGRRWAGRAPRTVHFRAEAGSVLVGSFDCSSISVGLADLAGRLVIEYHEPADLAAGPDLVIGRLDTLFDWVLEQQEQRPELWGISIGVPGAFRPISSSPRSFRA